MLIIRVLRYVFSDTMYLPLPVIVTIVNNFNFFRVPIIWSVLNIH